MHVLNLNLLGRPEARLDDEPLAGFATTKVEALLYYLACRPGLHPREELAGLLWGETPEAKARRSLTHALSNLRKLAGDVFIVDRLSVGLAEAAVGRLDAAIFEALVTAKKPAATIQQLGEAVALYRGDFMEGLYVKGALAFEEWQLSQRERLRLLMLAALDQLAAAYVDRPELDVAAGLAYARRLLALDPWRESAHRQMMRLLARNGQRSAALAQYESCRRLLAEELGVEPTPETTALYERLRAAGKPPPHNLPPAPNTFIGRETELAQIAAHLANPDCRLLTIAGPGGIGKTRLALQAARRYTRANPGLDDIAFADGVFFVSLAALAEVSSRSGPQTTNTLVSAIGEALKVSFQGPADLATQLLNRLRPKTMLLVLDNFESLLSQPANAVSLVLNVLQAAPEIKMLVTSRERLNVQEEWVFTVDGLEYPHAGAEEREGRRDGQPSTNYQSYSAIALFLQRAQQTQPTFTLSEQTLPDVVQICRLVGGAPLALELAASWLRVLPCREIAGEIEQSLDFLETSLRNVPARHRSIRVVFEHSWQMLTPPEQTVFCRLSVFRGGFQRDAAEEVVGASLPILASLISKSLLRLAPSGRYQVHELLRQFAAEKLTQTIVVQGNEQTFQTVWERHSRYFLRLVARHEAALHGSHPQQTAAELRLELDNVRQAWRWAVSHHLLADIEATIEALATFYELSGFFQEGEEIFAAAVALFKAGTAPDGDSEPDLICHLLIKQAWFTSLLGNYDQAKAILEDAIHLARQANCDPLHLAEAQAILGQAMVFRGELKEAIAQLQPAMITYRTMDQPRQLAFTLAWLGEAYARTQMFDEALAALQEALQLDIQLGNKRGQAFDYGAIANVYDYRDLPETALTYQQNALALYEELAYPFGIGGILNNIGLAHYHLGRYPEALTALNRALRLFRQLSNEWDEANTLENLGAVYTALGRYRQAQHCLEQALALFGGSKMGEAYVVYRLGQLYLEMGDFGQSRAYLQRAIALGEAMDDTKLAAACLGELGIIDHQENRLDQASAGYDQAIRRLKAVGARFDTAKFTVQQARLRFEQGHFEQAQTFAAEGIQLAQEAGHAQILFEGQLLQAKVTFTRGERAKAVQQVQDLVATAADEAKQAALAYELWKMGQGEEHGRLALSYYRQLAAQSMNRLYRERSNELQTFLDHEQHQQTGTGMEEFAP